MDDSRTRLKTEVLQAAVGVILVDHGSRRSESNAMLHQVVRLFQSDSGYSIVEPAHMELAEPSIPTAFGRCVQQGANLILVHPFFLFPGRHWNEDIPRLAATAAALHPKVQYLVSAPLGVHPYITSLARLRIEDCLAVARGKATDCPFCDSGSRCQLRSAADNSGVV